LIADIDIYKKKRGTEERVTIRKGSLPDGATSVCVREREKKERESETRYLRDIITHLYKIYLRVRAIVSARNGNPRLRLAHVTQAIN